MNKEELYKIYLKIPKATPQNQHPFNIYDSGYCVLEGHSFSQPHPHRHFTFEEFSTRIDYNQDFKKYIEEYINFCLNK